MAGKLERMARDSGFTPRKLLKVLFKTHKTQRAVAAFLGVSQPAVSRAVARAKLKRGWS